MSQIYFFVPGRADGDRTQRNLLGGKGAGLAEMANLGLPVPPGFTISTEACLAYFRGDADFNDRLRSDVLTAVGRLEAATGKVFGKGPEPLLLSVRSGARASMPGMMDTVLNLGLTRSTMAAVAEQTGDRRFALDCYRRLIQMYANVVCGHSPRAFEHALEEAKRSAGAKLDVELGEAPLESLVATYEELFRDGIGRPFPQDPAEQLWNTVEAVFRSWNNERANTYRRLHGIPKSWGTAANVQSMVFGNLGSNSATGVAFTRDPGSGERRPYGEYLAQAQGEDVVAGIRTPNPIFPSNGDPAGTLAAEMPEAYGQLVELLQKLEGHYRDMQDVEFTIERGRLFVLQTRAGKRTGFAQVRIAVDMVDEGLIDEREALARVDPESLTQLLAPVFDSVAKQAAIDDGRLLTTGLAAGPGAACGRIAFSPAKAVDMVHNKGERVILVRPETSPEDIEGMSVSEGTLTSRGGMTSHAAVVARGMGKPCIVGAHEVVVDFDRKLMKVGEQVLEQGDWLAIDGSSGEVIVGELPTEPSEIVQVLIEKTRAPEDSLILSRYERLMEWADGVRKLRVRANADNAEDAWAARALGAEGIGLCRTEHMFFHVDRILAMREMILAEDGSQRQVALGKMLPYQRDDFAAIFRVMKGLPVTIRLLDPPLHEFLPTEPAQIQQLAREMGLPAERIRGRLEELAETNPMLGHRGCRLAVTYPEIYDIQARAIFEAAIEVLDEGVDCRPEIMLPLIGTTTEMKLLRGRIEAIGSDILGRRGVDLAYKIGTMLEIPRAALIAGKLAQDADFFSFGTNDLTQLTFGYSRDDAQRSFLRHYVEQGILTTDPFASLDTEGVGELVRLGTERGRATRPDLKVGVCGEHGGDPASIRFFHAAGLDYVSCSPRRIPVARLAAALAELQRIAGEAGGEA